MLYYLFDYLEQQYNLPGAGLFQYISFRAGMAILISLLISMVFGRKIIDILRNMQVGESVRDLGLIGQKEKEGTPTMGGFIIILAILIPTLLMCKLDNIYVILMIVSTLWMAVIGFIDDYIKVFKKNKDGLSGKFKVFGQVGLGLIVGATMLFHNDVVVRIPLEKAQTENYNILKQYDKKNHNGTVTSYAHVKTTLTNFPFVKNNDLNYSSVLKFFGDHSGRFLWLLFIPIVIFIVTAVSNGANLTDGIDGLAAGTSAIIGGALLIFAYVSSNSMMAEYLNILFIPNSEELVIFIAGFMGAAVGFLWYNSFPAQVFMGDTGSLALGGIIASLAIILRKELLIPVLAGIFLVEIVSVMMQVGYFKYTKKKFGVGKRILLMSPLHHHYQKKGIHESKIVTRFWIVGIFLALITILTLKIR